MIQKCLNRREMTKNVMLTSIKWRNSFAPYLIIITQPLRDKNQGVKNILWKVIDGWIFLRACPANLVALSNEN